MEFTNTPKYLVRDVIWAMEQKIGRGSSHSAGTRTNHFLEEQGFSSVAIKTLSNLLGGNPRSNLFNEIDEELVKLICFDHTIESFLKGKGCGAKLTRFIEHWAPQLKSPPNDLSSTKNDETLALNFAPTSHGEKYNMWGNPPETKVREPTQMPMLTFEERKVLLELLEETANSKLVKGFKKKQAQSILTKLNIVS